jgi:hypothetical protein
LSPAQATIAIACSGGFHGTSNPSLNDAGVAIVDAATFTVSRIYSASGLMNQPSAFSLAFSSEDTVLVPTFGSLDAGTVDHLLTVNWVTGDVTTVASSKTAFDFGEVRCAAACGACFLTDAPTVVRRYVVDPAGAIGAETDIVLDDNVGEAPHYLGVY